jgi:hypothetical protein
MESGLLRRPSWGFLAFLVALGALGMALIAAARQSTTPRLRFDPLAATTSGEQVVDRVSLSAGQQKTLFANQDFKVIAKCVNNGSGNFSAKYGVKTLKNGALVFSSENANYNDPVLNKSDGLYQFGDSYYASGTAPQFYAYDYYQEFLGESPGGRVLIGRVSSGVHLKGADCIYDGVFTS